MRDPEPLIRLGLNDNATVTPAGAVPPPENLQFRRAQSLDYGERTGRYCFHCSRAIPGRYFQCAGKDTCPECAAKIDASQRNPPVHTLLKALPYGLGAAIAGSALYAILTIVTGFQFAFLAIVIGYMVGRSIRYASRGLGGTSQQVLAVILTYFAITTSYIPVGIYSYIKHRPAHATTIQSAHSQAGAESYQAPVAQRTSIGGLAAQLLMVAAAAPFLALSRGSGFLSLLIIFFGLQRAWYVTRRIDVPVTGPYGMQVDL